MYFINRGLNIKNQYCLSKCSLSLVLVFAFANNFIFIFNSIGDTMRIQIDVTLVVYASDHALAVARVPLAGEDADVGAPEGGVAQGVAHGVDGRVDVAQGVEEVPQLGGYAVRAGGQRLDQHQDVVRRPCDDEAQQDGRQCFGRLRLLAFLLRLLLLLGRIPRIQQRMLTRARLAQLLGYDLGVQQAHIVRCMRHASAQRQAELRVPRRQGTPRGRWCSDHARACAPAYAHAPA